MHHGLISGLWAMREEALDRMLAQINALGVTFEAKIEPRSAESMRASNGGSTVAVLNLFGPIEQRTSWVGAMMGGTSTEIFGSVFDSVVADKSVKAVVLNIDSPGGSVYGVEELGQKIYEARGSKPIIAVSNSEMASAAYWIGSAASEIVVTPSGEVGSIGVVAVHTDVSEAETAMGVKRTIVKAGKYKWEGSPYEPLGDEAKASIQEGVDRYYDGFTRAVARNRGAGQSAVKNGYGQGRMVGAKQAVEAGLADRVDTLENVLAKLGTPGGFRTKRRSEILNLDLI
jgi:capsid assembly protease